MKLTPARDILLSHDESIQWRNGNEAVIAAARNKAKHTVKKYGMVTNILCWRKQILETYRPEV